MAERPGLNSSVLRDGVAAFDRAFPDRVRAYYLEGSWADHTALSTSDIDLVVVFKDHFLEGEQTRARQVQAGVAQTSAVEFDVSIVDEAELAEGAPPNLHLGAVLIHGEDIRGRIGLLSIRAWARDRMHTSYWRTITLFGRPTPVRLPVGYPDPTGAFFGYDRRPTHLPDGSAVPGTRDLVRSIGWAATALVAYRAGRYIARKSECHDMYKTHIGDEWAPLISDIYVLCRNRWRYCIPVKSSDRQMLRSICERTLQFENYFLGLYREFLLDELSSGPTAERAKSQWVLERLPLEDSAVRALS